MASDRSTLRAKAAEHQTSVLEGDVAPDTLADEWWLSVGWEAHTGCDSIPTIERVYDRSASGSYRCIFPGCEFSRRDSHALWRHVHTGHGTNTLPPADFDPGPWCDA